VTNVNIQPTPIALRGLFKLESSFDNVNMDKLTNNKAIAMLDAAAKGQYGIPAVVCVSTTYPSR